MANELKLNILTSIDKVYCKSKGSKLNNALFKNSNKEILFLSNYLGISEMQVIFFSTIFSLNYTSRFIDVGDLINYFGCPPNKILQYSDDLQELYDRRIIKIKDRSSRKRIALAEKEETYVVNQVVIHKILQGEAIPEGLKESETYDDIFSLLEEIYQLSFRRKKEEILTCELFENAQEIVDANTHLPLIEKTKSLNASIDDKYLFLYIVWKYLEGDRRIHVQRTYDEIYDHPRTKFTQVQKFISKENQLIQDHWLELEGAEYSEYAKMNLTDQALDIINESGITLINKNIDHYKNKNIIQAGKIAFHNLFFRDDEMQSLDLLKNTLGEENFKKTQERLEEKALPKGIAVLLYGAPGTGKTESVLQIAKSTHRDIMKVDISASRSMWFGESEKKIKQIFTDYKSVAKKQNVTPILLFNEADAILSKRKNNNNSLVSDTENRIQNILLEEMETFDGILMATTNLANNLDPAFERRFLYKIEFKKPDVFAKSQIWKLKMSHLSDEDCLLLANQFDFSGGQIENIVRKNEIDQILYGSNANLNKLQQYCKEEIIHNQSSKTPIGFFNNYV